MTIPIKIRPVRSGDWPEFETLVAGICGYHGDTHALTRRQFDALAVGDNAPMSVLVAETVEGILAGYVAGQPSFRLEQGQIRFKIENLYVAPEFRRQRIGEVLMIRIIRLAKERHGATHFMLGAQSWNTDAIRFYQQLGFAEQPQGADSTRLVRDIA